jgi:Fe2+ or Zn2+ uptake regulation protein
MYSTVSVERELDYKNQRNGVEYWFCCDACHHSTYINTRNRTYWTKDKPKQDVPCFKCGKVIPGCVITVERAQELLDAQPESGSVQPADYVWVDVEGTYKDVTWTLGTNYSGGGNPDYPRRIHGLYFTLRSGGKCSYKAVKKGENVADMLETAYKELSAMCDHGYGRELTVQEARQRGAYHGGNCYHVYECSKCGELFGVDSSD